MDAQAREQSRRAKLAPKIVVLFSGLVHAWTIDDTAALGRHQARLRKLGFQIEAPPHPVLGIDDTAVLGPNDGRAERQDTEVLP
jgi:hypothetical protein